MGSIRYTSTMVNAGTNKGLKPDGQGYYTMIIGGLNVHNSAGEYYTVKGAKDLFESSSLLMRRVKTGALKGELGHPKFDPGTNINDYINRCCEIRETNVCASFAEVWLDYELVKGSDTVAICAKVTPAGPHAEVLERSFNDNNQNTAFSIRGFTDDRRVNGKLERELTQIITWDMVNEPGISIANKDNTMKFLGMESLVDKRVELSVIESIANAKAPMGIATESSNIARALLDNMGYSLPPGVKAHFTKW